MFLDILEGLYRSCIDLNRKKFTGIIKINIKHDRKTLSYGKDLFREKGIGMGVMEMNTVFVLFCFLIKRGDDTGEISENRALKKTV